MIQENNTILRQLEDEYARLWIDQQGILHTEFKKDVILNVEICKQLIDTRHKISEGEYQYWFYDFKHIKGMPSEGKEYADKYGQDFLHASAALVHNHLQKYLVNIFIAIKKPRVPFRAFTDKQDAITWLLKHKKQNESTSH